MYRDRDALEKFYPGVAQVVYSYSLPVPGFGDLTITIKPKVSRIETEIEKENIVAGRSVCANN